MATYPSSGTNAVSTLGLGAPVCERLIPAKIRSKVIDFAYGKGDATAAQKYASAGDIIQAVPVYAGEIVEEVYYRIVTASTTSSSVFGLGDGSATEGYHSKDQAATAAAGTIVASNGGTAAAGQGYLAHRYTTAPTVTPTMAATGNIRTGFGKIYSADDSVDIIIGTTAPQNGVVEVIVVLRELFAQ